LIKIEYFNVQSEQFAIGKDITVKNKKDRKEKQKRETLEIK